MVVSVGPQTGGDRLRCPRRSSDRRARCGHVESRNCWTLSTTMLRPNRAYGS